MKSLTLEPRMLVYKRSYKHVFLAITDRDAGMKNRFTVYKIKLDGDKRASVIGRELTVGQFKRLVASLVKQGA